MKNKIYILLLVFVASLVSCSDDSIDKEHSIFDEDANPVRTEFDKWILYNLTYPYNIEFFYRFEDVETDPSFNLAPASEKNSKLLAQIVKFAWLEAYDEAVGIEFTKRFAPKVIVFVGSPAFDNSRSEVIASAEGGLKVTLYRVNSLELTESYMNKYYFHTMHHEFCHILHQTKNYSIDFPKIGESTPLGYVGGDWLTIKAIDANKSGFVSPYAANEPNEDFAEMFATYITLSERDWNNILIIAEKGVIKLPNGNETTGKALILEKLSIVREYMRLSWGMDLDDLRLNLARRTKKIKTMQFEEFND